jgi:hypothetical protein
MSHFLICGRVVRLDTAGHTAVHLVDQASVVHDEITQRHLMLTIQRLVTDAVVVAHPQTLPGDPEV